LGFLLRISLTALTLCAGCSGDSSLNRRSVSGTIETDEARVASRYGGRVESVHVEEGANLKPGQVIAELDAAELRARRAEAAAQLAEMEAGPRPQEISAAYNDWEALVAEVKQASADLTRAEELFKQEAISRTEHEQAATKARTLEKNAAAAESRYDLLKAGTRPERIAQARAQLDELDAQLREMRVVAPTDSVLETLSVKVGDVLAPNREVATLLFSHRLWVRVYVPEPWLGHIKLGQKVEVRVDSEPNRAFEGVVEQIGRSAEFTPRNVQTVGERIKQVFGVKVRLDSSDGKLRAGMAADVFFPDVPKTL
jgi:HlyD family secretion protein